MKEEDIDWLTLLKSAENIDDQKDNDEDIILLIRNKGNIFLKIQLNINDKKIDNDLMKQVSPLLLLSTLRILLQKWSKCIIQLVKSKIAELCVLLTQYLLILLSYITENEINDDEFLDKYLKLLSYTLVNCSKLLNDMKDINNADEKYFLMLESANLIITNRVSTVYNKLINNNTKISDHIGKFVVNYMQGIAQFSLKYQPIELLKTNNINSLSDNLVYRIANCLNNSLDMSNINIILSTMVKEQSLQVLTFCLDAIWSCIGKFELFLLSKNELDITYLHNLRSKILSIYFHWDNTVSCQRPSMCRLFESSTHHINQLIKLSKDDTSISLMLLINNFINVNENNIILTYNEATKIAMWLWDCSSSIRIKLFIDTSTLSSYLISLSSIWKYYSNFIDVLINSTTNTTQISCSFNEIELLNIMKLISIIESNNILFDRDSSNLSKFDNKDIIASYINIKENLIKSIENLQINIEDVVNIEILTKIISSILQYDLNHACINDNKLNNFTNNKLKSKSPILSETTIISSILIKFIFNSILNKSLDKNNKEITSLETKICNVIMKSLYSSINMLQQNMIMINKKNDDEDNVNNNDKEEENEYNIHDFQNNLTILIINDFIEIINMTQVSLIFANFISSPVYTTTCIAIFKQIGHILTNIPSLFFKSDNGNKICEFFCNYCKNLINTNNDTENLLYSLSILISGKFIANQMHYSSSKVLLAVLVKRLHTSNNIINNSSTKLRILQTLSSSICKVFTNEDENENNVENLIKLCYSSIESNNFGCFINYLNLDIIVKFNTENNSIVSTTKISSTNIEKYLFLIDIVYGVSFIGSYLSNDEANLLKLSLTSYIIWSNNNYDINDNICSKVIESLIEINKKYDNQLNNNKEKNHKVKRLNKLTDYSLVDCLSNLRVNVLLLQWMSCPNYHFDTSYSLLISNSLFIIEKLSMLTNNTIDNQNIDNSLSIWTYILPTDLKTIYNILLLNGQITNQIKLLDNIKNIEVLFEQQYKLSESLSQQDWTCAINDITCMSMIQNLWNGNQSNNIDTCEMKIESPSFSYYKAVYEFLQYIDIIITDNKVNNIIEINELIIQFEKQSDELLLSLSTSLYCSNIIRVWLTLLIGKVMFVVYTSHRNSYIWTRKSLSYLSSNRSIKNSDNVLNYIFPTSLIYILPRIEGLLLISEIHEQSGSLESCLSYISEAISMTKNNIYSTNLNGIISLHSIRIWYRMHSIRLISCLNELCNIVIDNSDENEETVIKNTVKISKYISNLLNINSICYDNIDENCLKFRFIEKSWDVKSIKPVKTNKKTSKKIKNEFNEIIIVQNDTYSTNLSSYICNQLQQVFEIYKSSYSNNISDSRSLTLCATISTDDIKNTSKSSISIENKLFNQLNIDLIDNCCFDLIRDVRRKACLYNLKQANLDTEDNNMNVLQSFILGASSCGVSIECTIDSKPVKDNETNVLNDSISIIRKSCNGDVDSINIVINKLMTFLTEIDNRNNDCNTNSLLCFATIEASSNSLILGRVDKYGKPLIISLPIASEVLELINEWKNLMIHNKELLQLTMDFEKVKKWTEKDKKKWWSERNDCDINIEKLLKKLQQLLGPWKSMFIANNNSDTTNSNNNSIHEITSKLASVSIDNNINKKKSNLIILLEKLTLKDESNTKNKKKSSQSATINSSTLISIYPAIKLVCDLHILDKINEIEVIQSINEILNCVSIGKSLYSNLNLEADEEEDNLVVGLGLENESRYDKYSRLILSAYQQDHVTNVNKNEVINLKPKTMSEIAATLFEDDDNINDGKIDNNEDNDNDDVVDDDVVEEEIDYTKLKVSELKELLKESGLKETGKKNELIERIIENKQNKKRQRKVFNNINVKIKKKVDLDNESSKTKSSIENITINTDDFTNNDNKNNSDQVILILDEILQELPWESIPCLRKTSCSRMPGLTLLMRLISNKTSQSTDYSKSNHKSNKNNIINNNNSLVNLQSGGWFAIDIEGNLPSTRETMQSFLDPYSQKWNWHGVVAEIPLDSIVKSNHADSNLFIYCGHGAGEKLCDSYSLRKYKCPASLLWGCSSGKLTIHGIHDPYGAALSYLLGGAPFVVANLWDVTDKDIDRLSIDCMSSAFDKLNDVTPNISKKTKEGIDNNVTTTSCLSNSLVNSRDSCKLKYAVGSAPVMYGIPRLLSL